MHPDIIRDSVAMEDAKKQGYATIHRIQRSCPHTNLGATEGESYRYQSSVQPVRVCRECGMSEVGHSTGYQVLKGKALHIENAVLWSTALGLRITQEMKGRLIRKETTVVELVDALFAPTPQAGKQREGG